MAYFNQSSYLIRKKVFKIFGESFHIYDPGDRIVGYCKMKAFKLKEDIKMYTDESMSKCIFSIQARNIIDFSGIYDVFDEAGIMLGSFQRKGLKSLFKDEWLVLDTNDNEIGTITEDSTAMALFRRFGPLGPLFPQRYDCTVQGQGVCSFQQRFNPFIQKIEVNFMASSQMNPDFLMAGGALLSAIEGRQQ